MCVEPPKFVTSTSHPFTPLLGNLTLTFPTGLTVARRCLAVEALLGALVEALYVGLNAVVRFSNRGLGKISTI
jgi:hypothetical protein